MFEDLPAWWWFCLGVLFTCSFIGIEILILGGWFR